MRPARVAPGGARVRSLRRWRCVPLLAPEFWVTLGNYIGLYSWSRSAWCC